MRVPKGKKENNLWAFLEIFDCLTWTCVVASGLSLACAFMALKTEQSTSIAYQVLQSLTLVASVTVQIGTNYKVWER